MWIPFLASNCSTNLNKISNRIRHNEDVLSSFCFKFDWWFPAVVLGTIYIENWCYPCVIWFKAVIKKKYMYRFCLKKIVPVLEYKTNILFILYNFNDSLCDNFNDSLCDIIIAYVCPITSNKLFTKNERVMSASIVQPTILVKRGVIGFQK